MDIATIVGFVSGLGLLVVVMQISGGLLLYWDFTSLLIVLGGSATSVLMRWTIPKCMNGMTAVSHTIFAKNKDPYELITEIAELATTARQQSILALEKVVIEDRILAKAVRYMVDGYDPAVINEILQVEIKGMKARHADGRAIMDDMGAATPAFGMIGTVIGLIVIMANLQDPSKIGPGLAVALVTTLYGSMIANVVFIPLAAKLKLRSKEEMVNIEIIIAGVNAILNGENPKAIQEKLESYLGPQGSGEEGG